MSKTKKFKVKDASGFSKTVNIGCDAENVDLTKGSTKTNLKNIVPDLVFLGAQESTATVASEIITDMPVVVSAMDTSASVAAMESASVYGIEEPYLTLADLIDNLESDDTAKALTANQGRILAQKIKVIADYLGITV